MNKLFLTVALAFITSIASAQFSVLTTFNEGVDSTWNVTDKLGIGYQVNDKLLLAVTKDGDDAYELLGRYDVHEGLWATCIYNSYEDELAEIKEPTEESFERGENPFIEEDEEDEWDAFDDEKISDWKMKEIKGFRHGDYTLFEKHIDTESGGKKTVRFFSKAQPEDGEPIELPKGYEVKENKKTGVPYLKKKK